MRKIRKKQLTAFEIYQKMVKERYSMNGLWEEDYQAECLKILVWAYGELERMDFRRKGATPGQHGQEILCGNMNLYRALAKKNYGKACGILEDLIHLVEVEQNIEEIMTYLRYTIKKGLEQGGIFLVEQEKEER